MDATEQGTAGKALVKGILDGDISRFLTTITYSLRKAESVGRLAVVPKKVHIDTPPDPWGERRVVVRPRST